MRSIKEILIDRDGMDSESADSLIKEAKNALQEYLNNGNTNLAFHICEEYFGLEPDYLMELI